MLLLSNLQTALGLVSRFGWLQVIITDVVDLDYHVDLSAKCVSIYTCHIIQIMELRILIQI